MLCTLKAKMTASPLNGNSLYFYPFPSPIMSKTAPHCQLLSDYKYKIMQHQVFFKQSSANYRLKFVVGSISDKF